MTLRPGSTENQSAKHVSVRVHIRVVPLLCVLGSITSGSDWEEALYSLAHALRVRGPKPSGAYCGMCLEVTMQWLVYNIKQIRQQASVRVLRACACVSPERSRIHKGRSLWLSNTILCSIQHCRDTWRAEYYITVPRVRWRGPKVMDASISPHVRFHKQAASDAFKKD